MRRRIRRAAPQIACFLLVAAVYLAYFQWSGYDRFYWDAEHYWNLGREFATEDGFSLYGFDDPIRGYALPLFAYVLQEIAAFVGVGDVTIVRIVGALLAATLGVVVAPKLARALFSEAEITWGRILALNALIFVFWRDHFQFLLSDFPALLLSCVAILAFLRATWTGYVVAGLCLGVAANVRPAYAIVAVAAVVAAAVYPPQQRGWTRRAAACAVVLVSVAAGSLPQAAINSHHDGSWNPTVSEARGTGVSALGWGIVAQRSQTYVGPTEDYPKASVIYVNPVASTLLDDRSVLTITSYGDYARFVLSNAPLMGVSYALHAFNGMNVRYATPYIRDLRDRSLVLPPLQLTLLFVALLRMVIPEARRRLGTIRWTGVLLLLLPIVSLIAFAAEPRYFLPLHLLVYLLVCFGPATVESLVGGTRQRRLALGMFYVVFLAAYLGLAASVEAQIQFPLDD